MRFNSILVTTVLCATIFIASSVLAKDGVLATLHTQISASAVGGSQIDASWSLRVEKSGEPFNACAVFIRLIGPTGDSSEAFAECGANSEGHYSATAVVPRGGVAKIEIGVAGTMTDREGHSKRSDWLMPLADNPIHD